jgi:hypothetical protein
MTDAPNILDFIFDPFSIHLPAWPVTQLINDKSLIQKQSQNSSFVHPNRMQDAQRRSMK